MLVQYWRIIFSKYLHKL